MMDLTPIPLSRHERIALATLRRLVERGVIGTASPRWVVKYRGTPGLAYHRVVAPRVPGWPDKVWVACQPWTPFRAGSVGYAGEPPAGAKVCQRCASGAST